MLRPLRIPLCLQVIFVARQQQLHPYYDIQMVKLSSNARKRARKKALQEARAQKKLAGTHPAAAAATATNIHPPKKTEAGTNNNKKKQKRHHPSSKNNNNTKKGSVAADQEEEDDLLAFAAAWAGGTTASPSSSSSHQETPSTIPPKQTKHRQTVRHNYDRKPPAFPPNLPLPADDFLRDQKPYSRSFQTATETCYEGLVWEGPTGKEHELRSALSVLDDAGLFRTDVTQPAGLGAKLVPSYVTRCLLGEEGTTYRYLGLRMFAHPWNGQSTKHNTPVKEALQTLQGLNTSLEERTQAHLEALEQKRRQRTNEQAPYLQGQSIFNVTLINKMTTHKRLREEPMFGTNKYSVGWHADSSLEHFSSIAVYHTLMTTTPDTPSTSASSNHKRKKAPLKHSAAALAVSDEDEWAVALRVTHDAEGPRAKRLGDIAVEETAPPIAVSLPSGSAYFMLDDFNHHHQHAVLAPSSSTAHTTVRYSSTHRLLRQGHKVQDILARCHKTMGGSDDDAFRSQHGPIRWRPEQVLLTELENEWLRQFFIQGADHKVLLWGYWKEPLQKLFHYWEQLERRTLQVLALMQQASMERCGHNNISSTTEEGREALKVMGQVQGDRKSTAEAIYGPMANLLLERAKSRELWAKRERDSVFQRLPEGCRPIPFPVAYGKSGHDQKKDVLACSPMSDGSSRYLTDLASQVKAWGDAYENRRAESLPGKSIL